MRVEFGRGERAFWVVLFAAVVAHLLAYVLLAYPAMPQTVPTHWGADGAVDGWGDKAGTFVMAAVPLVVALVMLAVPRLDPKGRNFERFRGHCQQHLHRCQQRQQRQRRHRRCRRPYPSPAAAAPCPRRHDSSRPASHPCPVLSVRRA